ncbi:MAG: hypothetical protein ABR530_01245 [Pyrinomonadaceae bacterium]
MPLSKRARIEIYLPSGLFQGRLRTVLEREFLYTFGGCTVVPETKGSYLTSEGIPETEGINLIYADTPFDLDQNFQALAQYTDGLKAVALEATGEESILTVVHEIYHSV